MLLQERVVWAAVTLRAKAVRTASEPLLTQKLAVDSHGKDSFANNSSLRCLSKNMALHPDHFTYNLDFSPPTVPGSASTEAIKQQRPLGIISVTSWFSLL